MQIVPPSDNYGFPSLDITPTKLLALVQSEMAVGTGYGSQPGQKIAPLSLQPADADWPGAVDCSGEFRWLLFHALGQPGDFDVPDGSWNQGQWMAAAGFKESQVQDGSNVDGYIRAAWMTPEQTGESSGHIFMCCNNITFESYGGHGPGQRTFSQTPILQNGTWYVLAPPA
jgi:hypothetical protein